MNRSSREQWLVISERLSVDTRELCHWLEARQKIPELAWELRRGNGGWLSVIGDQSKLVYADYRILIPDYRINW